MPEIAPEALRRAQCVGMGKPLSPSRLVIEPHGSARTHPIHRPRSIRTMGLRILRTLPVGEELR